MKSWRNLLLPAILVMIPIAALGWPADELRVTGFVTIAKQDGPLQIVGFKLPEKIGHPPKVIVRNVSSKQILEFTIQVITGNLAKGSLTGDPSTPIVGSLISVAPTSNLYPQWREERSVPPGGESETQGYGLSSNHSVVAATVILSNCVHSVAMVNRVDFADGIDWKWSPSAEEQNRIWKESILPESSKSCDNSPRAAKLMEKLRGAAYIVRDSLTHADSALVQHYSVSCPLRPMHGKLFAVCPM